MLVLSRKKNEGIRIRDDIHLVVVEVRGDKVRLGIEAPKGVPVHRDEVYAAIQRKLEVAVSDGQGTPAVGQGFNGGFHERPSHERRSVDTGVPGTRRLAARDRFPNTLVLSPGDHGCARDSQSH